LKKWHEFEASGFAAAIARGNDFSVFIYKRKPAFFQIVLDFLANPKLLYANAPR